MGYPERPEAKTGFRVALVVLSSKGEGGLA